MLYQRSYRAGTHYWCLKNIVNREVLFHYRSAKVRSQVLRSHNFVVGQHDGQLAAQLEANDLAIVVAPLLQCGFEVTL